MILSGKEIARHMGEAIFIEPFDPRRLNPNSYNLTLHNELLVYENRLLDMKMENPVEQLTIPEEGLVLQPDRLYLGRTQEFTRTENFVPMLEGALLCGAAGAVYPRHCRVWGRGLRGLLDAGNLLRAAHPHLPRGGDLPNLLPRYPRGL